MVFRRFFLMPKSVGCKPIASISTAHIKIQSRICEKSKRSNALPLHWIMNTSACRDRWTWACVLSWLDILWFQQHHEYIGDFLDSKFAFDPIVYAGHIDVRRYVRRVSRDELVYYRNNFPYFREMNCNLVKFYLVQWEYVQRGNSPGRGTNVRSGELLPVVKKHIGRLVFGILHEHWALNCEKMWENSLWNFVYSPYPN